MKPYEKYIRIQLKHFFSSKSEFKKELKRVITDLKEYPNLNKHQIRFYTRVQSRFNKMTLMLILFSASVNLISAQTAVKVEQDSAYQSLTPTQITPKEKKTEPKVERQVERKLTEREIIATNKVDAGYDHTPPPPNEEQMINTAQGGETKDTGQVRRWFTRVADVIIMGLGTCLY